MQRVNQCLSGSIREMEAKPKPFKPADKEAIAWAARKWGFHAVNEPLQIALRELMVWLHAMETGQPPHWLTFSGNSGVGKTMLARCAWNRFNEASRIVGDSTHGHTARSAESRYWPSIANELRNGAHGAVEMMDDYFFLILDDVTLEEDKSGFITRKLSDLLNRRLGKWTIITTNQTVDDLMSAEARIADRMMRDGNRVYEIRTTPWTMR